MMSPEQVLDERMLISAVNLQEIMWQTSGSVNWVDKPCFFCSYEVECRLNHRNAIVECIGGRGI